MGCTCEADVGAQEAEDEPVSHNIAGFVLGWEGQCLLGVGGVCAMLELIL